MAFSVFPSRRLTKDLVLRSVLLWAGVRTAVTLSVLLLPTAGPQALNGIRALVGLGMFIGITALIPIVLLLDVRVCRESLLFANLGVSPVRVFALGMAIAATLETVLVTLFAVLGT